jgi:hypothetical protein
MAIAVVQERRGQVTGRATLDDAVTQRPLQGSRAP